MIDPNYLFASNEQPVAVPMQQPMAPIPANPTLVVPPNGFTSPDAEIAFLRAEIAKMIICELEPIL